MGLRPTRQIAVRFSILTFARCKRHGVGGRIAGQNYQNSIVDAVCRTAGILDSGEPQVICSCGQVPASILLNGLVTPRPAWWPDVIENARFDYCLFFS